MGKTEPDSTDAELRRVIEEFDIALPLGIREAELTALLEVDRDNNKLRRRVMHLEDENARLNRTIANLRGER